MRTRPEVTPRKRNLSTAAIWWVAMVRESRIVAALLLDEVNESAWKHDVLEYYVLQKNTKATEMRCAKTLRSWLELLPAEFLLALHDGDEELAGQVAFCATLQRNLLLLEFMERVVKGAYTAHEEQLYMYQWLEFVDECGQRDTHVFNWNESSLKKMGGTVFRMLAEAGYLISARSRKLQNVLVRPDLRVLLESAGRHRLLANMDMTR